MEGSLRGFKAKSTKDVLWKGRGDKEAEGTAGGGESIDVLDVLDILDILDVLDVLEFLDVLDSLYLRLSRKPLPLPISHDRYHHIQPIEPSLERYALDHVQIAADNVDGYPEEPLLNILACQCP